MNERVFVFLILLIAGYSCRNISNRTGGYIFPGADSIPASETEKLSPEAIADISGIISSPVEIAGLLQKLEIPFSQNYLATYVDAGKQSSDSDKALKLGILGADLAYLNMYEKTGSSLDLVSAIRRLAEEIKVGQFFNFESIKRLSQTRSKSDSLLFISNDSYSRIDKYLRENGREQLSALMIIGVWIEGQYLATQVVSNHPDSILIDRIGEQKIILNDLAPSDQPLL